MVVNDLGGPGSRKSLMLNDLEQYAKLMIFFLALVRFLPYIVYMTLKDITSGKELTFELLPNGILKAYDYHCGWDVSFKKVGDAWQGHMNGGYVGYKGILAQLNLLQQNLDEVRKLKEMIAEIV